jgi:4-coumarate--CoA ligase
LARLLSSNYTAISYLNNPTATAESFDDEGYFHTGDVGKLDAQGNLWIVDRLKEIMKVKGCVVSSISARFRANPPTFWTPRFQVSPADLEDALCASPLVQDAGVSSIYHEEHATEYPRAYVVPFDKRVLEGGKPAEEFAHALRKHMESAHAPYKWWVTLFLFVFVISVADVWWTSRIRGGFVFIEEVPKSPAGKILRRLLKETKGTLVHVYEEKLRAKM